MDTTATVVDIAPETGGATEKTDTQGTAGTETVASENAERAGGEQSSAEGGQTEERNVRQRGPSKLDTIRELRAKLRDRDQSYGSEMQSLRAQIEEMKGMISSGQNGRKPSKTFWEAPEEVMDERLDGKLTAMEKRLLDHFSQRESQSQQSNEWKLETSEATKFIKSQAGITAEDEDDIVEIIQSTPAMQNMRPLDRAKYATFLWKEQRGITDKSALKARASTVAASSTQTSGGAKTWTESDIKRELDKYPLDPKNWTKEQNASFEALNLEIRNAYKENRVKK